MPHFEGLPPPSSHTFLAKSEGVNPPLMFIHYQKCRIHPPYSWTSWGRGYSSFFFVQCILYDCMISVCIKMRVFCPRPQRENRPLWPCRKLWNAKQPKAGLRLSAALCWNKSFFLKVDNCFLLVSRQRSHNVCICFRSEEVHCNEQAAERKIQDLQQTLPRRHVRHWDILCCDPRSWSPWRCSPTDKFVFFNLQIFWPHALDDLHSDLPKVTYLAIGFFFGPSHNLYDLLYTLNMICMRSPMLSLHLLEFSCFSIACRPHQPSLVPLPALAQGYGNSVSGQDNMWTLLA